MCISFNSFSQKTYFNESNQRCGEIYRGSDDLGEYRTYVVFDDTCRENYIRWYNSQSKSKQIIILSGLIQKGYEFNAERCPFYSRKDEMIFFRNATLIETKRIGEDPLKKFKEESSKIKQIVPEN